MWVRADVSLRARARARMRMRARARVGAGPLAREYVFMKSKPRATPRSRNCEQRETIDGESGIVKCDREAALETRIRIIYVYAIHTVSSFLSVQMISRVVRRNRVDEKRYALIDDESRAFILLSLLYGFSVFYNFRLEILKVHSIHAQQLLGY